MALLSEKDQNYLRETFAKLENGVKMVMFTQERDCEYCKETRQIVEEVAGLSEKIATEILLLEADGEAAQKYGIDKVPAIALLQDGDEPKDYGIRFYGIPSGYEFSTLVEGIQMVGSGDSGLSQATKDELAKLDKAVHMQVFITPTCPYCPKAVHMAHQMAMESPFVHADMVEAMEFPELSNKYSVMGVPRTIINEDTHVEGAMPEPMILQKVLMSLN